jgi:hypothetical protein
VNSLIIDSRNGVVEYVLIAANGDISPNGGLVALPWSALQQPRGNGPIALQVTEQQLADAPHLNGNVVAELGNPGWRNRVYGFWGTQYPYYGTSAWYAPYYAHHPYANARARNAGTVGSANANSNADEGNAGNNGSASNNNDNSSANGGNSNGNGQSHALQVNGNGIVSMLQQPQNVETNQLKGVNVYGQNGALIGAINQVMIDTQTGHVAYVLVERSGFLGLNPVWYPVPIEAMTWTRNAGANNGAANNGNRGNAGGAPNGYPNAGYGNGFWGGYYGVANNYGWRLTVDTQALNYLPPVPVSQAHLIRYAPRNDLAQLYQAFGIQPYWNES